MNPVTLNPWSCALFLLAAFTLAGVAQTIWLKSAASARWAAPVDGGRTFRGKRVFGDNKTWRGFMVMAPAAGACFFLMSLAADRAWGGVDAAGLWDVSPGRYGLMGLGAGLGFMLGELPNSFLKRQWDVPPGGAPSHPWGRVVCFLLDRIDSILGLMLALSLMAPTPWELWAYMIVLGAMIHWVFSPILYLLGVKPRLA